MKLCRKCGIDKPLSEFHKHSRHRDGLTSTCKVCNRTKSRKWADENPERNRERVANWREDNIDKALHTSRKYHAEHREDANSRRREQYAMNIEREKQHKKEYREIHKEEIALKDKIRQAANRHLYTARTKEYRARKIHATVAWSDNSVIEHMYSVAASLRKIGVDVHVDHGVPLRHKLVCGLHTEANLQIVPAKYNQSKSNKFWPGMP